MGVRGKSPFRDYILILIGASIMGFAIKNIYDPIGLVTGKTGDHHAGIQAEQECLQACGRQITERKQSPYYGENHRENIGG